MSEKLLRAAVSALRSYQYGNASTELAEEVADAIEAALAPQAPAQIAREKARRA